MDNKLNFRVAQDIMTHFLSSKAGLSLLSGEVNELHLQAVLQAPPQILRTVKNASGLI